MPRRRVVALASCAVEMTEHRFLSEDAAVEETRFSNGRSIIVNFSRELWSKGNLEVPAQGYKIVDA
jgi:hypothetical protein